MTTLEIKIDECGKVAWDTYRELLLKVSKEKMYAIEYKDLGAPLQQLWRNVALAAIGHFNNGY